MLAAVDWSDSCLDSTWSFPVFSGSLLVFTVWLFFFFFFFVLRRWFVFDMVLVGWEAAELVNDPVHLSVLVNGSSLDGAGAGVLVGI